MIGRISTLFAATVVAGVVSYAPNALALTFTIYHTGGESTTGGSLIAPGNNDPNWSGVRPNNTTFNPLVMNPNGAWLANDGSSAPNPRSRWIGPATSGNTSVAPGLYRYTTTFDLTDLLPSTALLEGGFAVDNFMNDVLLNGNSLGISTSTSGFSSFTSFSISSGFQSGINTLTFVTDNAGAVNTPHGFRVEFTTATAQEVPFEFSPGLGITSLLGLWMANKARRKLLRNN